MILDETQAGPEFLTLEEIDENASGSLIEGSLFVTEHTASP